MDYISKYISLALLCVTLMLSACGGPQNILSSSPLSVVSSSNNTASGNTMSTSSQGSIPANQPMKVALLVPLSGTYQELGKALQDAAEMALFDLGVKNLELIPIDTKGTTLGAVRAFEKAARNNVNLVLGPVFSDASKAIAPLVYKHDINAISFSNDTNLMGEGIFLLGVSPEQQIKRVVDYTLLNKREFYAAIVPNNKFGAMVVETMRKQVTKGEGHVTKTEYYLSSQEDISAYVRRAMRSLIRSSKQRLRVIELTQRLKDINNEIVEPTEKDELLLATKEPGSRITIESIVEDELLDAEPDLRTLLIAEGGNRLQDIIKRLELYNLESHNIQLIGSGQWDDENLKNTPLMHGALFASTPPARRIQFEERFKDIYDYQAPRLASIAYDAVALSAALAINSNGNISFRSITNKRGFMGINGIFRFLPNGTNERGLSILTVTEDGIKIVEDAPRSF